MTLDQDAVRTVAKMWAWSCLVSAIDNLLTGQHWSAFVFLVSSCAGIAGALLIRTQGVDLTPECADIRGPARLRRPFGPSRRGVPWSEVQAVVRARFSSWQGVRLVLESGEVVSLPAPTTRWRFGVAKYERNLDRINQWWLANRGESWRPVLPYAPQPPR